MSEADFGFQWSTGYNRVGPSSQPQGHASRPDKNRWTRDEASSHPQLPAMSKAIGCHLVSNSSAKSTLSHSLDSCDLMNACCDAQAARQIPVPKDDQYYHDSRSEFESFEPANGDSESLLRQKTIGIIDSLLEKHFEFTEEVFDQIHIKIDEEQNPIQRERIILKILKTKLRKSKRKGKCKGLDNDEASHLPGSCTGKKWRSTESLGPVPGRSSLDALKAEQILLRLMSVRKSCQDCPNPGDRLLSLISPVPMGLYWINNVKFPEIKSIWRRRLLKEHKERKPEGWPAVVPENFRLNISKKALRFRSRPLIA